jgi:hypothetical protein
MSGPYHVVVWLPGQRRWHHVPGRSARKAEWIARVWGRLGYDAYIIGH